MCFHRSRHRCIAWQRLTFGLLQHATQESTMQFVFILALRYFHAMSFPHRALQPAMITSESQEFHSERMRRRRELGVVPHPAMKPAIKSKGNNMLKKLLSAAAIAATTYAFVPAQAAHVGLGCSDDNLAKTEGAAEGMPDVPGKFIAQREMAAAQAALLANKWRECAMHLANAAQAETTGTSYYTNTLAQGPAGPTLQAPPPQAGPAPQAGPGPYQSQWGWGPGQGGWGPGPGPAPQ
jgi:hypothetical protein